MWKSRKVIALIAALLSFIGAGGSAYAGFVGAPMALRGLVEQIRFNEPVLAPMAYTMFCMRYAADCKLARHRIVFRGGSMRMTKDRMAELIEVNAEVNREITPQHNDRGLAGEEWLISPSRGDCNDYAVTKRHELLARGWPMRNLLLSEVITTWGEHHLVLVVRAKGGDVVLDNLNAQIRPWSKTNYRWVRVQTPANPDHWASIVQTDV
jgi:predicted transglutaminase-like cysteine proteinase